MATQTLSTKPQAVKAVTVNNSPVISQVLPSLAVGDIVRFAIRQNAGNGQGLIVVNGQLMQAQLPSSLSIGDRVLASASQIQDQIIFRILDLLKPGNTLPGGPSVKLAEQLQTYIKTAGAAGLRGLYPFNVPTNDTPALATLQQYLSSLLSADTLVNSKNALALLLSSANGELAIQLRESAVSLRNLVDLEPRTPSERVLNALRDELDKLLEKSANDNKAAANTLNQLVSTLNREFKGNKNLRSDAIFKGVLEDLRKANANPDEFKALLAKVQQQLNTAGLIHFSGNKDTNTLLTYRLQQVASRLEQMATTQEVLSQLNPLMQALGEPALILFPFLFQGLLSHSEVAIDPDARNNNQGRQQNSKGSDQAETQQQFHRIQMNVPLPSMGSIAVDIAYREHELLARFTLENPEAASFLLGQLEHLAVILREKGFERAELVASVGRCCDVVPGWSLGLSPKTSVLA